MTESLSVIPARTTNSPLKCGTCRERTTMTFFSTTTDMTASRTGIYRKGCCTRRRGGPDTVLRLATSDYMTSQWRFGETVSARTLGSKLVLLAAEEGVRHPPLDDLHRISYHGAQPQAQERICGAARSTLSQIRQHLDDLVLVAVKKLLRTLLATAAATARRDRPVQGDPDSVVFSAAYHYAAVGTGEGALRG